MPNTKSGTLVRQDEIVEQVKQSKLGLIEFRTSPESFIMTKIGVRSFDPAELERNFDALLTALVEKKPEVIKGRYLMRGMIKSSMSPALKVDLGKWIQMASA